jgi:hypothetical protein
MQSEEDGRDYAGSTVAKKPRARPPTTTLGALIKWLDSENVRGIIIGGVAASLLGRPRFTQDIDALILLEEDRWERFLEAGTRFGFVARISNPAAFARRSRVFLVHHEPTGVDVDIALVGLPFEEESIANRKWIKIGRLFLPTPIPEDLIIMKAVAHRPQDMADISALVDANPKLDMRRIRRWVKEFSTALDMPDILTDLEKLLRVASPRKRR